MRIFIQIISYNGDVVSAMKDCVSNALNKDNLFFGVCLQQDQDVPPELKHERIKVLRVAPSESPGPGWALRQAQSFYNGQEYTMLIDSRTRFSKDWDKELIDSLNSLGSKAIITNQPGNFNATNGDKEMAAAYRPAPYQVTDNVMIWPTHMKGAKEFVQSNWVSSHFFFTRGEHCLECPYDPNLYYSEIEPSITVRSYTLGYDIYSHYKPLVWKDYSSCKMNWQDDQNWWLKDHGSKKRFRDLLENKLEDFSLGAKRTLKDFERYSGIDLLNKRMNKAALGYPPPYKFENEKKWESEYQKDYNLIAKWDVDEIEKCEDYDYWYFAIEDEKGEIIYRYDLRPERDADAFSFKTNFKRVVFKCSSDKIPSKLCVWPVSKSKSWLKKSKFDL